MAEPQVLLETKQLTVHFPLKKETPFQKPRVVHAVSDVSIQIFKGETFGLIGESGCGKSTFANATLGLTAPTAGEIFYQGEKLKIGNRTALAKQRRTMQKIFQDPATSINPRFTVLQTVTEPLRIRKLGSEQEQKRRAAEMLESVGLSADDGNRFVNEFSGGQQQRIAIARALILRPEYLVCDEPVSALDVSVHAQILNLLMDLQQSLGVTYLFISHNLAAVRKLCDRLAIMYLGSVVEYGDADKIFAHPLHPYTKALLSAVLDMNVDRESQRVVLRGDVASPIDLPSGCRFASRCPAANANCTSAVCKLTQVEKDHFVSCPYIDF